MNFKHVPYEGGSKAKAALLGAHVDFSGDQLRGSMGRDGKTRILATTAANRLKDSPNIPTVKELGYDVVTDVWMAFFAPKGTPKEIVKFLESAIEKVSAEKEYQKKLEAWGPDLFFKTGQEVLQTIENQIIMFKKVIDRLKK